MPKTNALNLWTRLSLGLKVVALTALSITVIEVVILYGSVKNQENNLLENEISRAKLLVEGESDSILKASKAQRLDSEPARLMQNLFLLDVRGVGIYNVNGDLVSRDGSLENGSLQGMARRAAKKKEAEIDTFSARDGDRISYAFPVMGASGRVSLVLALEYPDTNVTQQVRAAAIRFAALTLVVIVFVALVQYFWLNYLFARPLKEIRDKLQASVTQEGTDLSIDFESGGTIELRELAETLGEVFARIRVLLRAVSDATQTLLTQTKRHHEFAGQVNAMSREVSESIQQITKGAEDQAGKVGDINEWMQVNRKNMADVGSKAQQSSGAMEQAAESARAGGSDVEAMIQAMKQVHEALDRSTQTMHQLGEQSEKIGVVVELISTIAEQTDLLSLNAAIEAARAGDQGRGFAVVADEVRKLADQSSHSAQEISELIRRIQEETRRAVEEMEVGAQEARQSRSVIQNVGETLKQFIAVVGDVNQRATEIRNSMQIYIEHSNEMAKSVEDLAAVSEETAASTQEVAATTQEHIASVEELATVSSELGVLTDKLNMALSKFKF